MRFEQTSEKKFNRVVERNRANCSSELGTGRYANYYTAASDCVARVDQSLSVFEIAVGQLTQGK